jgi:hypothetical protein
MWCGRDDMAPHVWDDKIGTFRLQTERRRGRII